MIKKEKKLVKKDPYYIYKVLTKYLLQPKDELLMELCKDKKVADRLRYRAVSYFLSMPKIMWYVNKYLNNFYNDSKITNEDWFRSFADIARMYGVENTNWFYFAKYKQDEYANFCKTIRQYYDTINANQPSSSELASLYNLAKCGILLQEDLENMDLIISGKPTKKKSSVKTSSNLILKSEVTNIQSTKNKTINSLSQNIRNFIDTCIQFSSNRQECMSCELYGKKKVMLDTNLTNPGPVDICFIGLNPGKEEVEKGIPFIGGAGQIFRDYLDRFLEHFHFNYLITNCILCSTPNEKDIARPTNVIKKCKELTNLIHQYFPSKLTVVMGDKAMKSVGIKGTITQNNGKIIDGYFVMVHPSSAQYGTKYKEKLDAAFTELYVLLEKNTPQQSKQNNIQKDNTVRLNNDQIETNFSTSLTLFDVKIFNDDVVYILKDQDGKKKYKFEKIKTPIYIKNGEYPNCPFITDDVTNVVYLNEEQKQSLNRKLYHNMSNLVK